MQGKPAQRLLDREAERAALRALLDDVRAGRGRALIVRGEAGVGKSALLDHTVGAAADMRVLQTIGVESEMELAFAGLHLLCAPLLDRVPDLPLPQRDALGVAFGQQEGVAPDRFLVGVAVISLLAQAPENRPSLCVIDDAQWIDAASMQVLGFVARRLLAEPVGLLFAAREPCLDLGDLTELEVTGLPDHHARELLRSVVGFGIDARVQDQILAETAGNPLALLELPRGLNQAQLAGGFGLVGAIPARIEQSFLLRIEALPAETRSLMLVAAADPSFDSGLVWRAADHLSIPASAAEAAESAGLLDVGARVRFRHPLVRSAVYSFASSAERRAVHRALAEETDGDRDPDRRAWHLATAASGPDEEVARDLERSAVRAQARGGMAATAAFLQRAVELTAKPGPRSERALAAAQASMQAGAFDAASEQLDLAEAGPLGEHELARAALLRGQLAFASSAGRNAPALLVKAAKQLERPDAALARQTYLDAWIAAMVAGRFAGIGDIHEVSRAAQAASKAPGEPRPSDVLLDALAGLIVDGRVKAGPLLIDAVRVFAEGEMSLEERVRWAVPASAAAVMTWDEDRWHMIVARELEGCREAGVLAQLMISASSMATNAICRGDFALASSLIAEAEAIAAATRTRFAPYPALLLAGISGAEEELTPLAEAVVNDARAVGQGVAVQASQWAGAILYNGLSRYETARTEALKAVVQAPELFVSMLVLPELIEAASRSRQPQLAADAFAQLDEATSIAETDWARGIHARCRALVTDAGVAEDSYREALDLLSRTHLRPELARAHLLYGEWLRRQRRRADAREQLHTAHKMFDTIGMLAFAERARQELQATGEKARKRSVAAHGELTPQEHQIARLAASGLSNPKIAAQLFLSPHTVDYHLRKVFAKLDITSRRQLRQALLGAGNDGLKA